MPVSLSHSTRAGTKAGGIASYFDVFGISNTPASPEHEHFTCYGECEGGQVGQRWPEALMHKCGSYFSPCFFR